MKSSAWILLSGGLVALAFAPGACGGGSATTTTGTGGATASSTTHAATTGVVTGTGGGTGTTAAVCNAPSVPPSHGACYVAAPPPMPPVCPHGAGGGSSSAGSGGAASSAASTTGSGAGGAFDCSKAFKMPTACGLCIESTCCGELTACAAIPNCLDCGTGAVQDPLICNAADIVAGITAILACDQGCCTADCYSPLVPCNPVTNAPCDTANGEECDVAKDGKGGYQCYSEQTEGAICSMCDPSNGLYCGAGLTCLADGGCAKYCCDDGDCGSGTCDKTMLPGGETKLGVCLRK
jgi:hypothetical protein